jgi:two-component system chemotaxis response regulator CheY
MLKEIFKNEGIGLIDEVKSSEDALHKMTKFNYQVIFLDIELPGKSGLSIVDSVKASYPNTAVIMISSHNTVDNVREALVRGADGFIVKPFSIKKIKNILSQLTKAA